MRFNYLYPRIGNLFHFVSNLAQWHFSCRLAYKNYWVQKTGELTSKEKITLRKASALFEKYNFGDGYWGKVFLASDEIKDWKKLKPIFGRDIEDFREVIQVFEERFDKLWNEEKILLANWSEKLRSIENKLIPSDLVQNLDLLFRVNKETEMVSVILLMNSPSMSSSGGANLDNDFVTLEISRTGLEYVRPAVLVLWHEIVHSVWQIRYYQRLIEEFVNKIEKKGAKSPIPGFRLRHLINEGVTESLFPHGYLAKKYFGFPSDEYFGKELNHVSSDKNETMRYWRNYSAQKLMPIIEEYLGEEKSIDDRFLNIVYDTLNSCTKLQNTMRK